MRFVAAAWLIVALLTGPASAQDTTVDPNMVTRNADPLAWKDIAPYTEAWVAVKKGASSSQVADELAEAGWGKSDVAKLLEATGRYDLLKRAVAPGQVSYLAVPQDGAPTATAIQFGVPGAFGKVPDGNPMYEAAGYQEIRDEAIQQLRSAVEAVCSMPARPSTLRVLVTIKVLEIEATWAAAEVCKG